MQTVTIRIVSGLDEVDLEGGVANYEETIVKRAKYISFGPKRTYLHDSSGLLMSEGEIIEHGIKPFTYSIGHITETKADKKNGTFKMVYNRIDFEGASVLAVGSRFIEGLTDTVFFTKLKQVKLVREPMNEVDNEAVMICNIEGKKLGYVDRTNRYKLERFGPEYPMILNISACLQFRQSVKLWFVKPKTEEKLANGQKS